MHVSYNIIEEARIPPSKYIHVKTYMYNRNQLVSSTQARGASTVGKVVFSKGTAQLRSHRFTSSESYCSPYFVITVHSQASHLPNGAGIAVAVVVRHSAPHTTTYALLKPIIYNYVHAMQLAETGNPTLGILEGERLPLAWSSSLKCFTYMNVHTHTT